MLARHDLVWLTASGWDQLQAAASREHMAALAQWRTHDWPAVVRRREPGMSASAVAVGLPLPPDAQGRKGRRAGVVDAAQIARSAAPLLLADAVRAAPSDWRAPLTALLAGSHHLPPLRVFGSLAMQALTGQRYLSASSDLDLLATPDNVASLDAMVALLRRHGAQLPLDGEIVFAGGQAVAWKEWAQATPAMRVLVKDLDGVRLVPVTELRARLGAP